MPELINLEGGKVYFGSWIQRFHESSWSCCFCPVVAQDIVLGAHDRGATSRQLGSKERGRRLGTFKATPPVTSLPSTRPHFLKAEPPP
jgi:hypothetical protein